MTDRTNSATEKISDYEDTRRRRITRDEYVALFVKPSNPKDVMSVARPPQSCVPQTVLAEVGVAMLEGALKYGRHNYRVVGVLASVYYDATLRHLNKWWEGADMDADTGDLVHHITKAIASLVVLRDAMIQGKIVDDRPPSNIDTEEFYSNLSEAVRKLRELHADKSPTHYTKETV